MGRPRKFEEERAVEAAMRAFWRAGYEATSTEDLCTATGLGRSSIYNTFASKRELFVKALLRYMEQREAALAELLDGDLPLQEKMRTVLWWAVDPDPGEPPGCLVVRSMTELAPHDPEIAGLLRRDNDRRREMLRAAIEAGRARGEIDPGKDPVALAHFVFATVAGLRVSEQGGTDRSGLELVARIALDAF